VSRLIRRRLTYANVISTVALFVALGGVSYAAVKLPANSVGTKQIKSKAVTKAKVDPSLFKTIRGGDGPKGDTGATGSQGPKGDPGVNVSGVAGVELVETTSIADFTTNKSAIATCPPGKTVIGGGAKTEGVTGTVLTYSTTSADRTQWVARGRQTASGAWTVTATAICATGT
jgi:hypothetical protein